MLDCRGEAAAFGFKAGFSTGLCGHGLLWCGLVDREHLVALPVLPRAYASQHTRGSHSLLCN